MQVHCLLGLLGTTTLIIKTTYYVEPGDLVKSKQHDRMGIVVEVFKDLDADNPWIRVLFTHPVQTYQWCKAEGLEVIKKKEGDVCPPPLDTTSRSGSL